MRNKRLKHILLWGLGGLVALWGLYVWWLRPQVEAFLRTGEENPVAWVVRHLYPRFVVERRRFEVSYFLLLADQVVLRATLVWVGAMIWQLWHRKRSPVRPKRVPSHTVEHLLRYFAFVLLIYTYDWCYSFYKLSFFTAFYEPLWLVRFLPGFSLPWLWALWAVMVLTAVRCLWLGRGVWLPAWLFVVLQAYLYSFGKLDHTFAPFTYVCLLMPWTEAELRKARQQKNRFCDGAPLGWIRIAIALCYVQAGLEKLLLGGHHWWDAAHLRTFLLVHGQPQGVVLAAMPDALLETASVFVLLWQLAFIGVLHPKTRLFFVVTAFFFHLANYLFLGVGWWVHTYVWCYPFFFDSLSALQQPARFLRMNTYKQKQ